MAKVGRYELGELLGEGASGFVYAAHLPGLDRAIALKVMPGDGGVLEREARLGSLLRHRHLVDVYEVGRDGRHWFCAMELCEGGDLQQHAPLPPRAVVEVGLQVASALAYAHEALGLVHQDLKPRNLLVSDGEVKVADLGLAAAEGVQPRGGTPGFAAPEQLTGDPVDVRADVYGLAATLLALATGSVESSSDTLDPDLFDETPEACTVGHPTWLGPLLARCLAPREERPGSMEEVRALLEGLQVDGPGLREHLGVEARTSPEPGAIPEGPPLVGREALQADLLHRVGTPGAIALRGPAGIGKSAVAVAVARTWRASGRGPVWFCGLEEARGDDDVVTAVSRALGMPVPASGGGSLPVGFALSMRGPALLVLDTVEHLPGVAELVQGWLRPARQLTVLLTSQVVPGVPGERVIDLPPLDEGAAAELLRSRAQDRGVELDADDPRLAELAAQLDGVPLALELAAGRLGVLSVDDVLERLGPELLRSGGEGRQATLDGALAWSWSMLPSDAQRSLAQLSVLPGTFSSGTARAALGPDADDLLETLAARSMVQPRGEDRWAMLRVVRDHVAHRVVDAPEVRLRVARHAARLPLGALDAEDRPLLEGACRTALEVDDGPLARAALKRLFVLAEQRKEFAGVSGLVRRVEALSGAIPAERCDLCRTAGLARLWSGDPQRAREWLEKARHAIRAEVVDDATWGHLAFAWAELERLAGHFDDAEAWLAGAVARRVDRAQRGALLGAWGTLSAMRGDRPAARQRLTDAVALLEADGRLGKAGRYRTNLANVLREEGDLDAAQRAAERGLAAARATADRSGESVALGVLGTIHSRRGAWVPARDYMEACLRIARELGNRHTEGVILGHLGVSARSSGDLDTSVRRCEEALAVHAETGNTRYAGYARLCLGRVWLARGQPRAARQQLQVARLLADEVGDWQLAYDALAEVGKVAAALVDAAAERETLEERLPLAERLGLDAEPLHARLRELDQGTMS